ncbi:helicase-related protein [Ahrensia sp. R2A130]|uniref:helicase-related protein n=1 Tax=Ahrensia sp. R2A130 TaxID=744979 RepID=UPI0001E0E0EC|nr:helicase-related protein [Ahrensia sp. R2A130]EFL87966.1 putative helicase [Ahrensia sp. R2A130]
MNLHSHPDLQTASRAVNARVGRGVTAVLGPTNTGKTHLAIERMLAHPTGMIGLPLRLLAREVYSRVVERVGPEAVALVTGEEKIRPKGARFIVSTVEAMPPDVDVHFLAIDEVQIATNLDRGHTFTDRLLNLRGTHETMLLGSAILRPALEALLPGINIVTRPRLSQLHYAGSKKITRLPRRSAIVAFSADEVYAIAELIRRQRGAAAVVLGSLSPRTRNAQVELYQSGDVDFLVATDAIGMGLNLDVDHVAFAQDSKFDGYTHRRLKPAEFAQIAGRAGRHLRDGTFGVTGNVDPFEDELVKRLEAHEFPPEKLLQWRNRDLDFSNLTNLMNSLDQPSNNPVLVKAPTATDQRALTAMAATRDIRDRAQTPEQVASLWQVAQIPDYRKIAPANHSDMLGTIYRDLADDGHINEDWFSAQVNQTDVTSGDIDALSNRIAHIRTWTFVSHRMGWLKDGPHWQAETRAIEDRLSDALHDRLTKRFVDRRTSVLMKRLRENAMLEAEISATGEVTVEGHHVGELAGFRFTLDASADGPDAKAVLGAAQKALATEIDKRADRMGASPNSDVVLDSDGTLRWIGAPVGRLSASEDALNPRVILLADEQLSGPARDKVSARLDRWIAHHIDTLLKPLRDLADDSDMEGMARGVAFRLIEAFGTVARPDIADDIKGLEQNHRATLRRKGVRFGAHHIFIPALLKPAPAGLVTLLWALKNDKMEAPGRVEIVTGLANGRTSMVVDTSYDNDLYRLAGFRALGAKAVRIDILERLADFIRPAISWRYNNDKPTDRPEGAWDGAGFTVTNAMLSILGATHDDMADVLRGLGYKAESMKADAVERKQDQWDIAARAPKQAEPEKHKRQETTAENISPDVAVEAQAAAVVAEHIEATPEVAELVEPAVAAEPAKETPDTKPANDPIEAPETTEVEASAAAAVAEHIEGAPGVETAAAAMVAEAAAEEAVAAAEKAPENETVEEEKRIDIWRPARERRPQGGRPPRRDNRQGQNRGGSKPQDARGDRPPRNNKGGKGGGGAQRNDKRPPKVEKPIDPDNPFAALMALKDDLSPSKGGKGGKPKKGK